MEDDFASNHVELGDYTGTCTLSQGNQNYSPERYDFDDDGDDPLGCPEIAVKINDDWTVSSDEPTHTIVNNFENSAEDDAEVDADNNNVIDTFRRDIIHLSKKEPNCDEEEQIVPSFPTKIYESTFREELSFSETKLDSRETEEVEAEKEVEETKRGDKEGKEQKTEKGKEEEKKEAGGVPEPETTDRINAEKETGNSSNPQPP